jgi:hypothetical protein
MTPCKMPLQPWSLCPSPILLRAGSSLSLRGGGMAY